MKAVIWNDETLGAGGTIARLTASGNEVWVCIVCDGVTARHTETSRQRECAERACEVLGVTNVTFCELPDQRLDALDLIDVIRPIERCVQELRPDTVLTQFKEDVNQDHRVVFAATMVATRPSPNTPVRTVMCFETASSTEWAAPFQGGVFAPNLFVDISATLGPSMREETQRSLEDVVFARDADFRDSALYQLVERHKPDVIVDCINTATAISYQEGQDEFQSARQTKARQAHG